MIGSRDAILFQHTLKASLIDSPIGMAFVGEPRYVDIGVQDNPRYAFRILIAVIGALVLLYSGHYFGVYVQSQREMDTDALLALINIVSSVLLIAYALIRHGPSMTEQLVVTTALISLLYFNVTVRDPPQVQ